MKLLEALELLRQMPAEGASTLNVALACGFTPLHLQTLLTAHLRAIHADCRITLQTGLYGNCLGTVERMPEGRFDAAAVVLEWPDFDPRLDLRHLGGWDPVARDDILQTVTGRAARFREALARAAAACPVALCLPTLPLPPVSYLPGWQAGVFEVRLAEHVSALAALSQAEGVRIVNKARLDRDSPVRDRRDVKGELTSDFPYRLPHADLVASALAQLLIPSPPKKGLITDLDDVLWRGILGDVGVDGVSWELDKRSHIHALYQQLICSLAATGVLVAVASKNPPDLVDEVFRRDDMLLPRERIFPIEINWGPKSASVNRILRAWNIAGDSVVFVDDSPMELAEVQVAEPSLTCLRFPTSDDQATYELFERLRDLFGKEVITLEDALRLESLRRAAPLLEAAAGAGGPSDDFLEQAEAELTLDFTKGGADPRALELVNKTNQFNLNGRRYVESAWRDFVKRSDTFLLRAGYKDKYGPLGTIAVLAGRVDGAGLVVDAWVMSCRAFSRRIEHRCLEQLFEWFDVDQITFDFRPTPRNGPLRDFFQELLAGPPEVGLRLAREAFAGRCPPLFHRLATSNG
jgi:FkbH-like protein